MAGISSGLDHSNKGHERSLGGDKVIIKLGLRNVLRNRRRSFLSSLAIGIGLASLIFADGFIIGMKESLIKTVTETYLGQAQIHAKGYRERPEAENTIKNLSIIKKKLNELSEVKAWTTRVSSVGMISSPNNMINTQVIGIDKDKEKRISKILQVIVFGKYLETSQDILIGQRLAKKLDIQLGEKIVMTVAQAESDELSQELFRVSGIFEFGIRELDGAMAFILDSKLAAMINKKDQAHEIVIKFHDIKIGNKQNQPLWQELQFTGDQVESWADLVPEIMSALEMTDESMGIISGLLLIIVLLGILNTLFMSIFERMFEFGVLQALGTRSSKVFQMILAEAVWLGLFSIVIGIIVCLMVTYLVNLDGISYAGVEMGEVTMTEPIYVVVTAKQFIYYPFLLIIFTIVAAIYPGLHATRITLVDAMKKSL